MDIEAVIKKIDQEACSLEKLADESKAKAKELRSKQGRLETALKNAQKILDEPTLPTNER